MKIRVLVLIFVSWQVAYWGGNLNNGTNAGLWNANFNNSSGNTNANIGAQLSYETSCLSTETLPLGKTQKTNSDAGNESERFAKLKQMKRYGNLFDQLCTKDNVETAYPDYDDELAAINNAGADYEAYQQLRSEADEVWNNIQAL